MDLQRRNFLRGKVGAEKKPIRLPWLIEADKFTDLCTQCEKCVASCEENIIVKGDGGFPEIDFTQGECTFCAACANACPEPLFIKHDPALTVKPPPWSYHATISEQCLTYSNVSCQSCQDSCEPSAIRFQYTIGAPPTPEINLDACTGCGACVAICPSQAIGIKPPPS
jgi:ferredoxin-type protein NapF